VLRVVVACVPTGGRRCRFDGNPYAVWRDRACRYDDRHRPAWVWFTARERVIAPEIVDRRMADERGSLQSVRWLEGVSHFV